MQHTAAIVAEKHAWSSRAIDAALAHVPGFLGCFPSDELPKKVPVDSSLIINYSDARDPRGGTHWVAARFPRGQPAQWFDSYGRAPDSFDKRLDAHTTFRTYLAHHTKARAGMAPFGWSHKEWQFWSPRDSTCGAWAALFVATGGRTDTGLWKKLGSNRQKNGEIVATWLESQIKRAGPIDDSAPTASSELEALSRQ